MKWGSLNADRTRLLASLAFNFIAKVPGIAAVFFVLPLISRTLGTATYGELLSALALGSVCNLPFGGINAVGRRLLAAEVGARDTTKQANVFVTTTTLMFAAALAVSIVMVLGSARSWTSPVFIFVSLLPILSGFFNVFDNIRASYNEHYVTALFQLFFQVAVFGSVLLFGLPAAGVVLAGLSLQSPAILASISTLVVLVIAKPFLLSGRIEGARAMLIPIFGIMVADGALAALLNLSVYWLNVSAHADMAAWVGTFVRLFQSFMSPVLLILFPVTSYISIRWNSMASARQQLLHKLFIVAGLLYGCIVGGAMAIAGPAYIGHMFKLSSRGDWIDVLALSVFMGAVIAQKAYTMLIYAVSEARFISYGTAALAATGVLMAAVAGRWLSAMGMLDVLFLFMGVTLPALLLVGDRYIRRSNISAIIN